MSRLIQQGATDQSTTLRFLDSVTFEPQDVDHSTAGLALWYRREGGLKVTITPAALSSADAAHTDGGVEPIDDGYTRVDLPDAAVASGAAHVEVGGTATGMICLGESHHLVPWDPQASALSANVTQISDDATAASNLEAQFDGTGLVGSNYPARQGDTNSIQASLVTIDTVVDSLFAGTNEAISAADAGTSVSVAEYRRDVHAGLYGKTSGSGTGTVTISTPTDSVDVAQITMTGRDRSASTIHPPS